METTFMNYVESDLADDMELIEWRRTRLAAAPRKRRLRSLMRRAS
jgi:hypothetical protein